MSLEHENSQNPELIAEDLETRRTELNDTISQLSEQLDPSNFMKDMSQDLSSYGAKAGQFTVDVIRRNPTASLLTLAGIAWAIINESRSDEERARSKNQRYDKAYSANFDKSIYTSRADERYMLTSESQAYQASSLYEPMEDTSESNPTGWKDSTLKKGEEIVEKGRHVKEKIAQKSRAAGHTATDFFSRNPLAVGALGIIAGVTLGSLIPTSRTEDRLMGDAKNRATDQLAASGERLFNTAKDIGKEGLDDLKHDVKAEVDRQLQDDSTVERTRKQAQAVRGEPKIRSRTSTTGL